MDRIDTDHKHDRQPKADENVEIIAANENDFKFKISFRVQVVQIICLSYSKVTN